MDHVQQTPAEYLPPEDLQELKETCDLHGFVLSPDGACLRCVNQGNQANQRRLVRRMASGLTLVLALLLGLGVARSQPQPARTSAVAPSPPARVQVDPLQTAPEVSVSHVPSPASTWEADLARYDADRAAIAASREAEEKQRRIDALALPLQAPEAPCRYSPGNSCRAAPPEGTVAVTTTRGYYRANGPFYGRGRSFGVPQGSGRSYAVMPTLMLPQPSAALSTRGSWGRGGSSTAAR